MICLQHTSKKAILHKFCKKSLNNVHRTHTKGIRDLIGRAYIKIGLFLDSSH